MAKKTESELRNWYASIATSFIGTQRGDDKHKNIIDTYNANAKPLPRGYKVTYTDSYCMTAASAFALWAGIGDVFPLECGCPEALEKAKTMGCWQEADNYQAKVGDCILFDWQDDGNGDNTGCPDHVEIIYGIDNDKKQYLTVTPNDGNHAISATAIGFDQKFIRGFITPQYTKSSSYTPDSSKTGIVNTGDAELPELNLRIGPSSDVSVCSIEMDDGKGIRHTVSNGETVTIIDEKDGWYKLRFVGKYTWTPWVKAKYIQV